VSVQVLFMVRRQTWRVRRFEIFESARYFRIESNRDMRFEFESNFEASQVPTKGLRSVSSIVCCTDWRRRRTSREAN